MKNFFQSRIFVISISCFIALLIGASAYSIHMNFKNTVLQKAQQQVLALAETASNSLTASLLNIQVEMETLALNPLIPQYIKQKKDLSEIAKQWLFSIKNTLQRFSADADTIYMLDEKGYVRSRIPYKENWIGQNYSQKPSVKYVLQHQIPCVRQATTNSGVEAIAICVPVFEKQKFVGALRTLIRFPNIGKLLNSVNLGEYGHAELINTKDGLILYHPKQMNNGRNIFHIGKERCPEYDWAEFDLILSRISSSSKGIGIFMPLQRHKIIAFSRLDIPETNWAVLVTIPYDEINAPINQHGLNISILAGITAIIISIGLYFFQNFQSRKFILEKKAYFLENLNQYNQHIFSSMPYAIAVANENSTVDFANEVYKNLFCEKDQTKCPLHPKVSEFLREMQINSSYNKEIEIGDRLFSTSITDINLSEDKSRYLILMEDITRRNKLAVEIQKKEAELIHSTRLASLGVMAAGIAHEINQPLASIMNYSENIKIIASQNDLVFPQISSTLDKIIDQTRRAGSIVKHLKSFTRNGDNDYVLLDINTCINKVVDFLQPQIRLQQITLNKKLGELCLVKGNSLQLEQVFTNILCNAVDALSEVENPPKNIFIKSWQSLNTICVAVTDNGCGFSLEHELKLFDPFFTSKAPGKGTGLGLSISYRIIKEHGGKIIPENMQSRGAKFTIELPCVNMEATDEE